MTHELKTWQAVYDDVAEGRKKFEVRKNDRGFKVGDTLVLNEWITPPEKFADPPNFEKDKPYPSGRSCRFTVTYILEGPYAELFGLKPGYVVLGIEPAR